ncbi:GNAT family N-acetyltransferase [Microbacterium sp. BWT-B31]|uniref:GNAT family N-acetyltransferase n=1 Tax=Microbacterium sp. BWT-B31 TaxID=3232072 RepID=UPI00352812A1
MRELPSDQPIPGQSALRVVPANEASWDDMQAILTGTAGRCQCERQRLGDHDWWHMPERERGDLLRAETHCGDPRATETIGIVAYLGDEPAGWCAVDRRSVYGRLRGSPVPWKDRPHERKDDDTVWAIACLVVRKGLRHRHLTYDLVAAAVDHARARRGRRRGLPARHRRQGGHLGRDERRRRRPVRRRRISGGLASDQAPPGDAA